MHTMTFDPGEVVLGTYKMGGTDWGPVNDLDSVATIQGAVDAGLKLIDTATGYGSGRAEKLIAYGLDDPPGRRGKCRIMTKWYLWEGRDGEKIRSCSPQAQEEFCRGSLKRLGVEKLDVVLLHRDDGVTPIEVAVEALAGYQARGVVANIGVSNYSLEHLERAQRTAPLQNCQPRFGLLDTTFRDDGRLAFCREHGISVGVFNTLGQGVFVPQLRHPSTYAFWDHRRRADEATFARRRQAHTALQVIADRHGLSVAQLAIAWALSHDGVTFVIAGASTPEQARHNLAATGKRLSAGERAECESIVNTMLKG